ncbi:hypothetical protein D5086_028105 [Populus alba]|uniref:Uncharacterized protein n=1 Tax=Populus alba TaxID=43335 RepID=A0ACC4AXS5_POPAL
MKQLLRRGGGELPLEVASGRTRAARREEQALTITVFISEEAGQSSGIVGRTTGQRVLVLVRDKEEGRSKDE